MRWIAHGRRDAYASEWVRVSLDDVEIPGGARFEHHVLHFPRASVTAVVTDDADRVLLMWRHRFITGAWGWEVPAGWADPGEDPATAIRREIEETGYRPGTVRPMTACNALSGISHMRFTAFVATGAPPPSWPYRPALTNLAAGCQPAQPFRSKFGSPGWQRVFLLPGWPERGRWLSGLRLAGPRAVADVVGDLGGGALQDAGGGADGGLGRLDDGVAVAVAVGEHAPAVAQAPLIGVLAGHGAASSRMNRLMSEPARCGTRCRPAGDAPGA